MPRSMHTPLSLNLSVPLRLSLSASLIALVWPAAAQTSVAAAGTTASTDTVIVTGTRSKDRTALTTAVPVDILSADDLQRGAGADGSLASALQALLPSFNFPHQSNSGAADHVRAAQLRGMSPDQVLVLINGKRRHVSAVVNLESKTGKGTNPVDFGAIPVSAIQRVEVLRDGAGAQYGSDAIGGVINVILADAPEGSEISSTVGAHHTRFAPTHQTLTDGQTVQLAASSGWHLGETGRLRAGVELEKRRATNRAGADQIPAWEDSTPANLATQGQRNYMAGDPDTQSLALWFNGSQALDAAGAQTAYAFGTWSRRNTVGAAYFRYPDSSANPTGASINSIYPQGYRPATTGQSDDLGLTAGLRSSVAGWDTDASLSLGRNDFDYGVKHSLNASLGAASPTAFHLGDYRNQLIAANLDATRPLDLGLAQPATLALGAEARQDHWTSRPGDAASYALGPITTAPAGAQAGPGLQPGDAAAISRHVLSAYAELSADVTRALQANAALRHDHYSDFGGATTAKLSGRYAFTPALALRAAASNSFRAPSLAQQGFSFTVSDYGDGGALSQVRTLPVNGAIAQALGAPALKPERSRNLSLGLTAQPAAGVQLSLDGYRIDVDKRITLSERFSGDALSSYIQSQFGLTGVDGVNFFTNAVDTRTTGADLVSRWTLPAAGGQLTLGGTASWAKTTLRGERSLPAELAALGQTGPLVGLEERNTLTAAAPKTRLILSSQWQGGPWKLLARGTRQGSTTRVFDFGDGYVPTQTYSAVWQLDLEAEWAATPALRLALGGQNVTNRYPSRSIADISYFGNFPYDVLSPVGFNGAYWYARATYRF